MMRVHVVAHLQQGVASLAVVVAQEIDTRSGVGMHSLDGMTVVTNLNQMAPKETAVVEQERVERSACQVAKMRKRYCNPSDDSMK